MLPDKMQKLSEDQTDNVVGGEGDGYFSYHTVQPGETLYSIAKRYNTRVDVLVQINDLPFSGAITVGQVLKIPPWY